MKFNLQPLTGITPGPFINNPIGPFLPWIFVYFFAGLAGVVTLTSCFNFTNLSIARSLTRAKEIGVRKVTGALRWHVFVQFMSESIIVSLFALILALIMLIMIKPLILGLSFAHFMKWDLCDKLCGVCYFYCIRISSWGVGWFVSGCGDEWFQAG
ncbi:MAG: FtsX-like permease family protein [Flammeovirgaceae bacterium]|nr:FtsX-like permease family protein [Flammeovirgaceae bacterium]